MSLLEFMAVILFGYLIGFRRSDLQNMVVLTVLAAAGIGAGVGVFILARAFLLSPNGPFAVAAILSACFAIWKLGVAPQRQQASPLDRRAHAVVRKAG